MLLTGKFPGQRQQSIINSQQAAVVLRTKPGSAFVTSTTSTRRVSDIHVNYIFDDVKSYQTHKTSYLTFHNDSNQNYPQWTEPKFIYEWKHNQRALQAIWTVNIIIWYQRRNKYKCTFLSWNFTLIMVPRHTAHSFKFGTQTERCLLFAVVAFAERAARSQ